MMLGWLLARAGVTVIGNATSVEEALDLVEQGAAATSPVFAPEQEELAEGE